MHFYLSPNKFVTRNKEQLAKFKKKSPSLHTLIKGASKDAHPCFMFALWYVQKNNHIKGYHTFIKYLYHPLEQTNKLQDKGYSQTLSVQTLKKSKQNKTFIVLSLSESVFCFFVVIK